MDSNVTRTTSAAVPAAYGFHTDETFPDIARPSNAIAVYEGARRVSVRKYPVVCLLLPIENGVRKTGQIAEFSDIPLQNGRGGEIENPPSPFSPLGLMRSAMISRQ